MIHPSFIIFLGFAALAKCQYNLGLCRTHLIRKVYDTTVTVEKLLGDGDYTVLYTSGLKQFPRVDCARLGYARTANKTGIEFYTYIQTEEATEMVTYPVTKTKSGKFRVKTNSGDSNQYMVYSKDGVLLIYWCKKHSDDNFDNNIWIIAAKTGQVEELETKKAVLEMLYHNDYRHLIDLDVEDGREEVRTYVKLSPCEDIDIVLPANWE